MRLQKTSIDSRFLKVLRRNPHLLKYVRQVINTLGIPEYYNVHELDYSMKKLKNVNIIYPVGDGIFIHIYTPPQGTVSGYRKYVAVEPPRPDPKLEELIEMKLADAITEADVSEELEEKKKILLSKLEKVVRIVDTPVDYSKVKFSSRKIPIERRMYTYLRYYLIRDKVGLGVLEPFIRDPWIEDVTAKGVGFIYLIHKIFGPLETNIEFKTMEELDLFVIRLSERVGKPVSHARPIVDATLPDGSRLNIVYGADVSLNGSNFTIRKFSKVPISITQLIAWNTLNEYIAAYLWMLLENSMSGLVCGETASGKTTTLNAISVFIPPTAKIISIEDTAEVQLPHPNWVRELTRETGSKESSITMFDLLKTALRQRPNYIIVGEIRGPEAAVAFQAMQSVTWETPIMIKDVTTGEIKLVPIGALVDEYYSDGEERVPKSVENLEVLSLDKLGRITWSKIKYVLRHRTNEVYEIEYEGGGTVRATGSHSVFVLDEKTLEIRPKHVSELREGELLVTFINRRFQTEERLLSGDTSLSGRVISGFNAERSSKNYDAIKGLRKPRCIKLTKNLINVLNKCGVYDCAKPRRRLRNSSPTQLVIKYRGSANVFKEYNNFLNSFDILASNNYGRPSISTKTHNLSQDCNASNFFGSCTSLRSNCIKQLLETQGFSTKRKNVSTKIIIYFTRDRLLATKFIWLARLIGLESKLITVEDQERGKHYCVYFKLYSSNEDELLSERIPLQPISKIIKKLSRNTKLPSEITRTIEEFSRLGRRYVPRKIARRVLEILEKYANKLSEDDRNIVDRLKILLNSDIGVLKVVRIRKMKYSGYVYDLSVPGTELFMGGIIPIALHNTGHPVLSTFHAGSVERMIQRLTGNPINVPKTFMDNLNFAIVQSAVWREGILVRRILSVNEILGYDPASDTIIFIPVFNWDPAKDTFMFRGRGASFLLEEKIALRKGISRLEMRKIYEELNTRAEFLRELVNRKVFNYFDVWKAVVKVHELGLEEALRRLKKGRLLRG